jgi:hypothetical protein
MKRFLAILLACAVNASAQTYITVTAETNRVIRTNFSLVRSQVSDLSGATFAISNITGLQTNLDGKLATNGSAAGLSNFPASLLTTNGSAGGLSNFPASLLTTNGNAAGLTNFPSLLLRTNGDAVALTNFPADLMRTNGNASTLTNFPASLLRTNGDAAALTNFPSSLLRTNGDGSALTNLPNANLSNAIGVLPISNGGSGATNQADARTAFGLGSAATNDASAFQPASSALTNLAAGDGSALTNVTVTDASTLTNFPAELLRTNGSAAALTNFPASLLRTNGDGSGLSNVSVDLTTVLPAYTNNAGKVLAVATGATNVEWIAVSNTVTDASSLTNYPAYLLQTNGNAAGLTNFPSELLRTNGSAANLTNFPTELLRTNGSAAGLTGFPTFNQNTTGTASNVTGVVQIANGGTSASDVTNARINLLPSYTGNANRILALNSNATDIIWTTNTGGGSGSVTSVAMTVPSFLSVSGSPITNSGTLAVTFSGTALAVSNGGTGATATGNTMQANLGLAGSFWTKLGRDASAGGNSSTAIGYNANAPSTASIAVGQESDAWLYALAVGSSAFATNYSVALGYNSESTGTNNVQIGTGTNSTANTIQFRTFGTVDSTEWGYLASASTQGGYAMTNTAAISTNRTFVSYDGTNYVTNSVTISNGIITGWTQ